MRWMSAMAMILWLIAGCDSPRDRPSGTGKDASAAADTGASDAGDGEDSGPGDSGMADGGSMMDSGMADTGVALIPDPGTVQNGEWTDVEPNDDPSMAVPQGILTGPVWMGFAMPYTTINDDTDVDYFVFKTGDEMSLANVYISACWGDGVDLLNMYLYTVENRIQGGLVASAESTDTSCETLVDFGAGPTILSADTTYLLEIRAAPDLMLGGAGGMYSA